MIDQQTKHGRLKLQVLYTNAPIKLLSRVYSQLHNVAALNDVVYPWTFFLDISDSMTSPPTRNDQVAGIRAR